MICWWIKWRISQSLDAGTPLPRSAERHIENCAACRAFMAAADSITQRMLADAPRADTPPVARAPVERIAAWRLPSLATAAAVAALLLVIGLVQWPMRTVPPVGTADVEVAALALVSPMTGGRSLEELAQAVSPDTQFERELQALSEDAMLAARHLMACLDRQGAR